MTATPPIPTGRWASFSVPAYRWLWVGASASFLSVQMMFVARGWLAWELTHSSWAIGTVYFVFGAVMLVGMPLGGVAADRVPKRLLLQVSTAAMTASQIVMAVLVALDMAELWMLLVSSLVQSLSFSLIAPARIAMAGHIVGRELLPNAVVLQQMGMNATRVFGPSAAAVILAVAGDAERGGIALTYAVTAVIMLLSFLAAFFLPPGLPTEGERRTPLAELRAGIGHVRSRPELSALVLTSILVTMIAFPYVALLPEFADDVLHVGGSGFGMLMAVSAIGGVAAALYSANRAEGARGIRIQTLSGFGFGAGLVILAATVNVATAGLAMVLVGFAATGFQVLNNTLALSYADSEFHGRVQGLLMMSFGAFGIAALPLGAIADAVGIRPTLTAMGLIAIGIMAGYVLLTSRREASAAQLAVDSSHS